MSKETEDEEFSEELVKIDPNIFIQNLLYAIEDESIRADRNSLLIPVFFILGISIGYYINIFGV